VVDGRQLLAWGCDDKGGFQVAGVARSFFVSELASDSWRGQRGGGNTFEQLDMVCGERSPER
jgi:hypothetical protein